MEVREARSFSADQEFQRIRSIIYQKENNLARLDAEIARLSEERTIESQSLRAHQILMAPVRRLPLELLSQIFVHCLDGHEFVSPDTTQAPILLTHVCSAWRKAAIFTPKLWCSINLKLLPLKQRSKPHIARLMETWLARSGRRPLSISLELHSNEAVASDMLKVLFCYMDRWQHVKLDLVMSNTPILSLLKQNFSPPHSSPLLETFNLRTEGGLGSRGEEHLTIMMHSAQRLRRFSWIDEEYSINVDPFNATPSYLTLPWSQLREINLHCQLSLWHCIGILHLSPCLESCTFNSVQLESQQPPLPFQIILPKLKRLSVSSAFSLSSLFDQLTLPALRELEMHFNYDGNNMIPAWSQAQFMRLLIRSSCHLESLLMRAPISEDELIACLERIGSSLVHLTVNGQLSRAPCVTNRILTLLTPRVLQDGQIVCLSPRLQRITLCRCMKFNHSISPGVLADMIESRWREPDASDSPPIISKLGGAFVSRAEYIELTLSASAISMDDVSRLETMRKEGLDLRFSYTS